MQQSYGIKPRLFKTQNVKSRHFSAPPIYNFIGPRPGLGWAGLGWAGLGWAGLGWAGLGWPGLGWVQNKNQI